MAYDGGKTYKDVAAALGELPNFYPNATSIAEFRPNSLTIHFHYLNRESYAEVGSGKTNSADRPKVEVVAHELAHWSDQVSSLWGQRYLTGLFDAYHAMRAGREELFKDVVTLYDEQRRILFPRYYRVVADAPRLHSHKMPWRIDFSAGQEFDAYGAIDETRPIYFVAFSDNENGTRVARQPITVGSLLETTATWAELLTGFGIISSLGHDEQVVERALWMKERLTALYQPDLTVYTAPVHMLAKFTGVSDLLWSYERGAVLANIALNMTKVHFDSLRHPDEFAPFGSRRRAFAIAQNRGYAFAVLARHASKVDTEKGALTWASEVLSRAGLPEWPAMLHASYTGLELLGRGLPVRTPLDEVRDYLLEIGRKRFLGRSDALHDGGLFDPLKMGLEPHPPMFDSNGQLFHLGKQGLDPKRFDPEAMHLAELRFSDFTSNLLQGCRGVRVAS
ncbi:hypothetical protein MESS2_1030166 [Mesorhizobium metallidurans STM 2683]|uniref:Uncharacterized protein n=1 Tax=Mesorhizobium metallidurans STM 2683 TaxID=1297569 RepID=M5EF60_9HYPH|nr:hypothetical protein [Mesorhizobium metallidurans]CCV03309.1 hypothetical protein MESS2_1030166 [Mesorhizobium metallidurans STM 2683]